MEKRASETLGTLAVLMISCALIGFMEGRDVRLSKQEEREVE